MERADWIRLAIVVLGGGAILLAAGWPGDPRRVDDGESFWAARFEGRGRIVERDGETIELLVIGHRSTRVEVHDAGVVSTSLGPAARAAVDREFEEAPDGPLRAERLRALGLSPDADEAWWAEHGSTFEPTMEGAEAYIDCLGDQAARPSADGGPHDPLPLEFARVLGPSVDRRIEAQRRRLDPALEDAIGLVAVALLAAVVLPVIGRVLGKRAPWAIVRPVQATVLLVAGGLALALGGDPTVTGGGVAADTVQVLFLAVALPVGLFGSPWALVVTPSAVLAVAILVGRARDRFGDDRGSQES